MNSLTAREMCLNSIIGQNQDKWIHSKYSIEIIVYRLDFIGLKRTYEVI
jgi:hypothetical protein